MEDNLASESKIRIFKAELPFSVIKCLTIPLKDCRLSAAFPQHGLLRPCFSESDRLKQAYDNVCASRFTLTHCVILTEHTELSSLSGL